MPRLWAKTLDYDRIEVGDDLPILVKSESQESIDLYAKLASTAPRDNWNNLHTDEEYAKQGIFGGTVNMGVATVAYVAELLEKGFPLQKLTGSGSEIEIAGYSTGAGRRHDHFHRTGDGQGRGRRPAMGGVRGDGHESG